MCAHPGCSESFAGHTMGDHEPMRGDGPGNASDFLDVADLSDEEIGLFPCDREEIDGLLAAVTPFEEIGTADGVPPPDDSLFLTDDYPEPIASSALA